LVRRSLRLTHCTDRATSGGPALDNHRRVRRASSYGRSDARSLSGSTIVISINGLGATRTLSTITPTLLATTTTAALAVTTTTTAAGANVPAAVPAVVNTVIGGSTQTYYTAAGVIICAWPARDARADLLDFTPTFSPTPIPAAASSGRIYDASAVAASLSSRASASSVAIFKTLSTGAAQPTARPEARALAAAAAVGAAAVAWAA